MDLPTGVGLHDTAGRTCISLRDRAYRDAEASDSMFPRWPQFLPTLIAAEVRIIDKVLVVSRARAATHRSARRLAEARALLAWLAISSRTARLASLPSASTRYLHPRSCRIRWRNARETPPHSPVPGTSTFMQLAKPGPIGLVLVLCHWSGRGHHKAGIGRERRQPNLRRSATRRPPCIRVRAPDVAQWQPRSPRRQTVELGRDGSLRPLRGSSRFRL